MRFRFLLFSALLALTACTDDGAVNTYSSLPANFVFRSCATVPQMRAALSGSPGSFFTVRAGNGVYTITSNDDFDNPYTYQLDAVDQRVTFLCRSGFVVGTPVLSQQLVAYDLACPNCYLGSISRPLTFETRTRLACPRCHCAYSLDDAQGILVSGETRAKVLLRYHVSYDGLNNLSVSN
ncbi:MAG: hypothetical protein J6M53_01265 [Bacteroidaceae bacterium]|nr:hypothetical protein [Bacteroidaceae bacterium]